MAQDVISTLSEPSETDVDAILRQVQDEMMLEEFPDAGHGMGGAVVLPVRDLLVLQ